MSDVRSLLKNERTARRIKHEYASYSTTGSLRCVVCQLLLKSESLWDGHLRSPGHIIRQQKLQDNQQQDQTTSSGSPSSEGNKKKRKADHDEETESTRKRSKPDKGLLEGFPDQNREQSQGHETLPSPTIEIQIPSRPATPAKPLQEQLKPQKVDEDEWAAFEADIAAAAGPAVDSDAVISAPAMTAAEKSREESSTQRRERQEAELEGDKEDAARKMEEELEEMEGLQERVRKMREKREALRKKGSLVALQNPQKVPKTVEQAVEGDNDKEEEDEDDRDDWDGFRMR